MKKLNVPSVGVRIKCPNPLCGYDWIYKGKLSFFASCPSCRKNVKIFENKISAPDLIKLGQPRDRGEYHRCDQEKYP